MSSSHSSDRPVSARYGEGAPIYRQPPEKVVEKRHFKVYPLLDVIFIIAALGLTLWLAVLLLIEGVTSWSRMAYLIVFWAVLAYLALPRLHQLFTWLYVPNYFIGRTRTSDGLLGDPVNLGLDGTAEDIHAAMTRAGWTLADEMTLRSAWGMIISSILRRSYPAAPVSSLFLFGRRHEFTYQQEVAGTTSQRHHVRFWKVPAGWSLPGGHAVQWLAAGTYDRSVGLSVFTGQITHKIDADIDIERDYILDTVIYADPQCDVEVIKGFSAAYHHRNGGGDEIRTDGDLPILDVTGAAARSGAGEEPARPRRRRHDPAEHHVPPVVLLFAGFLIALQTVAALVGLTSMGGALDLHVGDPGGAQRAFDTALNGVVAVVGIVLWILTVGRSRWARLALEGLFAVESLATLLAVSALGDTLRFSSLLGAGTSVLLVLAVSADAVRDWVSVGRDDPELNISDHGVSIS